MVQINICVNSTKFFSEKTIPILLNSLLDSGINSENIFVIEGGYDERIITKEKNYTHIQTNQNSLEYTGLIDIVEYELKSDYWFNIHDTCKVGKNFKEQNEYLKTVGINEIKNNFLSYSFYHFKTAIRGVFDPGRFDIMTFFNKEDGKQGFLEILNGNKSLKSLFKEKMIIIILFIIPIFFINIIKYFYFVKYILKNKHSNLIWYLFILLAYNILVSGPVNSSRYMMPFQIIVICFALKEFQKNLQHTSNRQTVSDRQ